MVAQPYFSHQRRANRARFHDTAVDLEGKHVPLAAIRPFPQGECSRNGTQRIAQAHHRDPVAWIAKWIDNLQLFDDRARPSVRLARLARHGRPRQSPQTTRPQGTGNHPSLREELSRVQRDVPGREKHVRHGTSRARLRTYQWGRQIPITPTPPQFKPDYVNVNEL